MVESKNKGGRPRLLGKNERKGRMLTLTAEEDAVLDYLHQKTGLSRSRLVALGILQQARETELLDQARGEDKSWLKVLMNSKDFKSLNWFSEKSGRPVSWIVDNALAYYIEYLLDTYGNEILNGNALEIIARKLEAENNKILKERAEKTQLVQVETTQPDASQNSDAGFSKQ